MNPAQKKFMIGALIIVAAIGYMIYAAVEQSSHYYYTLSEVKAMGERAKGRSLRVEGKIAPGTIAPDATKLKWRFEVKDRKKESSMTLPVYYEGVAPDMMQDDIDVVVEGKLDEQGTLVATTVLTSCPSRYDPAGELKKGMEHPADIPKT